MNPETPILMITLQIPVLSDTNVGEVFEAIAPQLAEALEQIKHQAAAPDPETIPQQEFNASVLNEMQEGYSLDTHSDLLATLGYAA